MEKNKTLTPAQFKALDILKDTSCVNSITARCFAERMWGDTNPSMFEKVKNTGNGATKGKGAWLCAGSYLGKLMKKKWAWRTFDPNGYYITPEGEKIYNDYLNNNKHVNKRKVD